MILKPVGVTLSESMEYPVYVEICGNCHTLISWNPDGSGTCKCGQVILQFIERSQAVALGIIKEAQ